MPHSEKELKDAQAEAHAGTIMTQNLASMVKSLQDGLQIHVGSGNISLLKDGKTTLITKGGLADLKGVVALVDAIDKTSCGNHDPCQDPNVFFVPFLCPVDLKALQNVLEFLNQVTSAAQLRVSHLDAPKKKRKLEDTIEQDKGRNHIVDRNQSTPPPQETQSMSSKTKTSSASEAKQRRAKTAIDTSGNVHGGSFDSRPLASESPAASRVGTIDSSAKPAFKDDMGDKYIVRNGYAFYKTGQWKSKTYLVSHNELIKGDTFCRGDGDMVIVGEDD